jgi:hypothetical protein
VEIVQGFQGHFAKLRFTYAAAPSGLAGTIFLPARDRENASSKS